MKLKIHEFQKIIKVMGKNFLCILFFFPIIAFSQVGVNTTVPNGMLDVQSTSNGVLIPRVQLTSITDNVTITNPAGGALVTSTLVYNMAAAGVSPNNVVAGFYYWDNTTSRWIAIAGTATNDHDWYEQGTTSPPNAITDSMFHTGNVAIGKNTTNSPLEVETNAEYETGIRNNFISNNNQGVTRNGFYNQLIINSNDQSVGINTLLTGSGSGSQFGISNEISNSNNGYHIGAYNHLNGNGTGNRSGTENYLQGSGDGLQSGTKNELNNSGSNINRGVLNEIYGSGIGEHYGTFNSLFGNGSGLQVGTANTIDNAANNTHIGTSNTITSTGNGANYGVFSNLNGTGQGNQYAHYSFIQNPGSGEQYGNYINMLGVGTGNRHGNFTSINNNQAGNNYANYSILTGDGNGLHYGSFSSLGGNGDGEHTGSYNIVSGTGIGTKYGSKNILPVFAGGTHYGVYSEVLKPGSTNFAGYFLGNVGIGTTTLNTYTFPPSRGTNGQIMQTDGFGNVSWQNPTSFGWELDGNTAITSPAVPVTYGTSTIGATENFLGTTDNNDVTIGTNTIERMRIERTTGDVGIGTANPVEKLHVFDNSDTNKSSVLGEAQQVSSGVVDYDNIGVKGFGRGTSGWGFGNGVMGIGDRANSFYATGVYGHLGSTAPILPSSNQAVFANGNGEANAGTVYGLFSQATGTAGTRIGGYFTATGGLNNYGIVVPNNGGNVGIGTITPNLARLQVDGMAGNTTALFRGNSTTSQGISMVADWPGVYFNSYYNGAIRQMSNSGYPTIINTDQSSGGLVFQTTNVANTTSGATIASIPVRMTIAGNGNVGIGAPAPSNLLHVNSATSGAVRIVDGTQAAGRVLTSNATGVATWQAVGINNVVGTLAATGATINYLTGPYLQTGASITLPPGRYAVNVTMLMAQFPVVLTQNDSSFWLRSTFSDSAAANPTPSIYIEGSDLISGNLPGSNYYGLLTGTIIINNTSGATRTFWYVAGNVVTHNTTGFITNFGGTLWSENNIIAYRLN